MKRKRFKLKIKNIVIFLLLLIFIPVSITFVSNLLNNKYPIEFFENIGIKATLNLFEYIYLNGWSVYLSDKYPDLNFSTSKNGKMGVYGGNGFYSFISTVFRQGETRV